MTATMKANRIHRFGGPEVILFEDLPRQRLARTRFWSEFMRQASGRGMR